MRKCIWGGLVAGVLALGITAGAAPVKVYIFAGQSNMDGTMNKPPLKDYGYGIYSWVTNASNPTLYHYWRSGGTVVSTNWVHLNTPSTLGLEHVVAYRMWTYWQNIDTNQQIAIIKVSQGSTSLNSFWNPGGRDRDPWFYNPNPLYFSKGSGYQTLTNRIVMALSQLTEKGIAYEVAGFFWYQGEGDASGQTGGDNYPVLFEDLVNGWADRDPAAFPNDTKSIYGGSLRELCGLTNLPSVTARISWQIKGSPAWGARSGWEGYLTQVRAAQTNYAETHVNSGWVDVDDIPLMDFYHYTSENYIEIGERFAQVWLDRCTSGGARAQLTAPSDRAQYMPSESTIEFLGQAQDGSGFDVTNLVWTSAQNGGFGSGRSVVLNNPVWTARVYSVGSASATNSWVYTTNYDNRIILEAFNSNGTRTAQIKWIRRAVDEDTDGLPDAWASNYWGGGSSGGATNDADGDGASNWQEYVAGTDPSGSASVFSLNNLQLSPGGMQLQWQGISAKTYRILWTRDLLLPMTNVLGHVQASADGTVSSSDTQNTNAVSLFYQVQVLR
jgi:hypothetical protein